jgi:hypothetical protein
MAPSRGSLLVLVLASLAACSSSSSATNDPPAKPAAPVWDGAPTTLAVYDGRTATVAVTIRTSDPAKLSVTAASDAIDTELVPSISPSTDGAWHGTLRVRPGYALATGTAAGASVIVDMTDGDAQHVAQTIVLDVHKLGWQRDVTWDPRAGTTPQTREHGAFFYDADAKAAFLLSGSGYNPQLKPIEDSWRLDVASGKWTPWTPTGDAPVAGGSRRVAAIPGTKKLYAYGGYIGFETTATDDGSLYRVDLGDPSHMFTKLKSVGAGPARELHAVAYDAKSEQLVVFGGITTLPTQDALDDTWLVRIEGDTATWTQLQGGKAPSARYGSFTAFDAEARRFVVWSGGQMPDDATNPVNAAQDAWALDLSVAPPKWSKLAPSGTAPKGRRNGCSMPDPSGRRLFVYGGTSDGLTTEKGLYVLDIEPGHEAWTKLDLPNAPPLRSSGFGFATQEGAVTCAFGNDKKGMSDLAFLGYADPPK